MGWGIGYCEKTKRDVGYGVPGSCDHPDCDQEINRGLSYVCGGNPFGGDRGCGLYFCLDHLSLDLLCDRCENNLEPFELKPDHPEWIEHKLNCPSWQKWRDANPDVVQKLKEEIQG